MFLSISIQATNPLVQPHRIPWKINMKEDVAILLQVNPLSGCLGRDNKAEFALIESILGIKSRDCQIPRTAIWHHNTIQPFIAIDERHASFTIAIHQRAHYGRLRSLILGEEHNRLVRILGLNRIHNGPNLRLVSHLLGQGKQLLQRTLLVLTDLHERGQLKYTLLELSLTIEGIVIFHFVVTLEFFLELAPLSLCLFKTADPLSQSIRNRSDRARRQLLHCHQHKHDNAPRFAIQRTGICHTTFDEACEFVVELRLGFTVRISHRLDHRGKEQTISLQIGDIVLVVANHIVPQPIQLKRHYPMRIKFFRSQESHQTQEAEVLTLVRSAGEEQQVAQLLMFLHRLNQSVPLGRAPFFLVVQMMRFIHNDQIPGFR